jgi:hypothetical protein
MWKCAARSTVLRDLPSPSRRPGFVTVGKTLTAPFSLGCAKAGLPVACRRGIGGLSHQQAIATGLSRAPSGREPSLRVETGAPG